MRKTSFHIAADAVLFLNFLSLSLCGIVPDLTTDQDALFAFKARITSDPYKLLADNWSYTTSICNWTGVICSVRHQRVTALNLFNFSIQGTIAPHLGNLTFLSLLDISSNNFTGVIPSELSKLHRLKEINVGYNSLTGQVPLWFGSLPELQHIVLIGNNFTGIIPPSLSNISKLETLNIAYNSLSGNIPNEIQNFSFLERLDLKYNQLTGLIPFGIFNISTLQAIDLTSNSLSGGLPLDLCDNLPQLVGLYLSENQLGGKIPSNLYKCTSLQHLSLSINHFNGSIPSEIGSLSLLKRLFLGVNNFIGGLPREMGNLSRLEILSVRGGSLTGKIPPFIFNLSSLRTIDFTNNSLSGTFPTHACHTLTQLEEFYFQSNQLDGQILSNLLECKMLKIISMSTNRITGQIPKQIGNLTQLKSLYLANNNFTGELPAELGNLDLEVINVRGNGLFGRIPSSIFNMTTINMMEFSANHFSGHLPSTMGLSLPNLKELYLDGNKLSGKIPSFVTNASQLTILSMSFNSFTGPIPNFGNLRSLRRLLLGENNLTGDSPGQELQFVTSLTSCRYLDLVELSLNQLNGMLPLSIGNFSTSLRFFNAFGCNIKGSIPNEIGNVSSLTAIYFDNNELMGSIPMSMGKLKSIERIHLEYNKLQGHIPSELCKLGNLGDVYLSHNMLDGPIPACIGELKSLRRIYLDSNRLESRVPLNLWTLNDLLALNLSTNNLQGNLPLEIEHLKVIQQVDLSLNQFSGKITSSIGSVESLFFLSLANNKFQGSIPQSLGNIKGLVSLDLSHNNLSGSIPKSLEALKYLQNFNVSYNRLEGEIPTGGSFSNFTFQSFVHNYDLCGIARLQVPACDRKVRKRRSKNVLSLMKYILPTVLIAIVAAVIVIIFLRRRKKSTKPFPESEVSLGFTWKRISYQELIQVTDNFSEINILGAGSYGLVYKGTLSDGLDIAVKVFNLHTEGATKSFETEIQALGTVRHRNLVKIIGYCSNPEFKALVLEYMANGSLDKWLYSDCYSLDMLQRLNISTDVALALEYLHHDHTFPVVHCDLKPSNVLLDEHMTAHVGDFGISRLFGEGESMAQTRTLATIGYMAPEYGAEGIVSTSGDVYSFGVMLLEIFTKKGPRDEMFAEEISLKSWVNKALVENMVTEVIDSSLFTREDVDFSAKMQCASSIFTLAMACLANSPVERIRMREISGMLQKIKTAFLGNQHKKLV